MLCAVVVDFLKAPNAFFHHYISRSMLMITYRNAKEVLREIVQVFSTCKKILEPKSNWFTAPKHFSCYQETGQAMEKRLYFRTVETLFININPKSIMEGKPQSTSWFHQLLRNIFLPSAARPFRPRRARGRTHAAVSGLVQTRGKRKHKYSGPKSPKNTVHRWVRLTRKWVCVQNGYPGPAGQLDRGSGVKLGCTQKWVSLSPYTHGSEGAKWLMVILLPD